MKQKSTYSEKLKDPRWQKKRLEIFERDNWTCQICDSKEKTLHVHHWHYENGLDPWEYANFSLTTLCNSCHEMEHNLRPLQEQELLEALRKSGVMSFALIWMTEFFKIIAAEQDEKLRAKVYKILIRRIDKWKSENNSLFNNL